MEKLKKFRKNDPCKYGSLSGKIIQVNFKKKFIEGEFYVDQKLVCILFDLEGYVIPCGKYIDLPRLEKL